LLSGPEKEKTMLETTLAVAAIALLAAAPAGANPTRSHPLTIFNAPALADAIIAFLGAGS
jgi:hypothetical protein